jgi:hypothetical protein
MGMMEFYLLRIEPARKPIAPQKASQDAEEGSSYIYQLPAGGIPVDQAGAKTAFNSPFLMLK